MLQPYRGTDLAPRLLATAEAHARAAGATRLVLWSDTRFDRAHRFYEKHSYIRHGPIGVLHDLSNSLEFGYAKPVSGIEVLDAAGRRVGRTAAGRDPVCLRRCGCIGVVSAAAGARRRARHFGNARPPMSPPAPASCSRPGTTRAGGHRDAGIRVLAQPAASRRGAEAAGASRRLAGAVWHAR